MHSARGNEADDGAKEVSQVSEEISKGDEKVSDEDKKDESSENDLDQDSLTEDDLFFSNSDLVSVKDGEIIKVAITIS